MTHAAARRVAPPQQSNLVGHGHEIRRERPRLQRRTAMTRRS